MAVKLRLLIDAGHGLKTPGKRSPDDSLLEFNFNKPTAEYVNKYINEYENVETHFVYDRDGSTDTDLNTRADKANTIYAKNTSVPTAYVSVHANAFGNGFNDANGIETFVDDSKPKTALALADKVQAELIKATGLRNRGVKTGNFAVLRETHMTAILVECGFMTNKEELALLKSDSYRKKVAKAIVAGLAKQYGLKKKATPKPAPLKVDKNTFYRVIAGSYQDKDNAVKQQKTVEGKGFETFLATHYKGKELFYRVVVGSFNSKANATERAEKLEKAGIDAFLEAYYK